MLSQANRVRVTSVIFIGVPRDGGAAPIQAIARGGGNRRGHASGTGSRQPRLALAADRARQAASHRPARGAAGRESPLLAGAAVRDAALRRGGAQWRGRAEGTGAEVVSQGLSAAVGSDRGAAV